MTGKESLEWLKENYIYLIEEYYNKSLGMKQCVIDMTNPKFFIISEELDKLEQMEQNHEVVLQTLESATEENTKLKKVINHIKEHIPIMFLHLPQSRFYSLNIRGVILDVPKEKYYELQEVLKSE